MPIAIRRKVFCLVVAVTLALALAGTTITSSVFADCATTSPPTCSG